MFSLQIWIDSWFATDYACVCSNLPLSLAINSRLNMIKYGKSWSKLVMIDIINLLYMTGLFLLYVIH